MINEEIAANACFTVLSKEQNFKSLVNQNKSLAQRVYDFFADFLNQIRERLVTLAKQNKEYRVLQQPQNLPAQDKIVSMMKTALSEYKKNNAADNSGVKLTGIKFSKVGQTEDGRIIYKTNYQKNTPKSIKQNDIINLVQNIWSKSPINLNIIKDGKQVPIEAKFNPELTERSDLSKIVFGNRKGNNSEKRITLDLSYDLYSIAENSTYVKSKTETGKFDNPAHNDVSEWHYFITNLVYRDADDNEIDCYMNIDIKQNSKGNCFYSFAIEKGIAPQTLLAVVTENNSATIPNTTVSQIDTDVNNNSMQKIDKNNTAKNDSVKYSIKYPKYTDKQLKNNVKTVLNMDSVISLKGNEFDGDESLSKKIDKFFSSLNNNVYSNEFGDVLLNNASRRSDIRHGSTRIKNTSYVAIPDVIKKGKTVFMTNKKNVERLIVAAPINVANEKYFMGVMLLRDSNTQRLYLHDVIMEKETELTSKVSLNTTEAIETESNLFMTNILQKVLSVNNNSMQNNSKYSLRDSDGNELTKQQQEYFKDSKVTHPNILPLIF